VDVLVFDKPLIKIISVAGLGVIDIDGMNCFVVTRLSAFEIAFALPLQTIASVFSRNCG